ncbi:MAG: hypothetical protein LC118_05335 [Dehalococcoidia bacterium]|nr:hypothetical protein [Dehalococcoidia bacterium]
MREALVRLKRFMHRKQLPLHCLQHLSELVVEEPLVYRLCDIDRLLHRSHAFLIDG